MWVWDNANARKLTICDNADRINDGENFWSNCEDKSKVVMSLRIGDCLVALRVMSLDNRHRLMAESSTVSSSRGSIIVVVVVVVEWSSSSLMMKGAVDCWS